MGLVNLELLARLLDVVGTAEAQPWVGRWKDVHPNHHERDERADEEQRTKADESDEGDDDVLGKTRG